MGVGVAGVGYPGGGGDKDFLGTIGVGDEKGGGVVQAGDEGGGWWEGVDRCDGGDDLQGGGGEGGWGAVEDGFEAVGA